MEKEDLLNSFILCKGDMQVNMEVSLEEQREAEEAAKELGLTGGSKDSTDPTGETALMELFRSKKNARKEASASFLSMLEDKFCKPAPYRKRKKRDTNNEVKLKRKRKKVS